MYRKFICAAALAAALQSMALGQVPDDVGISFPSEFVSYKAGSNGTAKLKMETWLIYFKQVPDLKAKAVCTVNYYLSTNSTLDDGDTLIGTKNAKVKTTWPKRLKRSFKLTPEHKGKYILGEVISLQDQWPYNNVDSEYIPHDAY